MDSPQARTPLYSPLPEGCAIDASRPPVNRRNGSPCRMAAMASILAAGCILAHVTTQRLGGLTSAALDRTTSAEAVEQHFHKVLSNGTGKCLIWSDVNNIVSLEECNSSNSNAMWSYSDFRLAVHDDKCLDMGGKEVHVWKCSTKKDDIERNQHWLFDSKRWLLRHVSQDNKCLTASSDGTAVTVESCDLGSKAQKWTVHVRSLGQGRHFQLHKPDGERNGKKPAPPPTVKVSMTVEGVDYNILQASKPAMQNFKDATAEGIAGTVGVPHENVKVAVSPGSVKVEATITAEPGVDAATLETDVQKASKGLQSAVVGELQHADLGKAATGPIEVTDVKTEGIHKKEPQPKGGCEGIGFVILVLVCLFVIAGVLYVKRKQQASARLLDPGDQNGEASQALQDPEETEQQPEEPPERPQPERPEPEQFEQKYYEPVWEGRAEEEARAEQPEQPNEEAPVQVQEEEERAGQPEQPNEEAPAEGQEEAPAEGQGSAPMSESLQTLVGMGFDQARAQQALDDAGGDVDGAAAILLSEPAPEQAGQPNDEAPPEGQAEGEGGQAAGSNPFEAAEAAEEPAPGAAQEAAPESELPGQGARPPQQEQAASHGQAPPAPKKQQPSCKSCVVS